MNTSDYQTIISVVLRINRCKQTSEDIAHDISLAILQQNNNKVIDRKLITTIARRKIANIYRQAQYTSQLHNRLQHQTQTCTATPEPQLAAREILRKLLLSPEELQILLSGTRQQRYMLRKHLRTKLRQIMQSPSTI